MHTTLIWDEAKRAVNLSKHGLDFADADDVLKSRLRLDVNSERNGQLRTLSMSYALGVLAVLVLVHFQTDAAVRVISFRRASRHERNLYDERLENGE